MEINTPLHNYVHLWIIGTIIVTGLLAVTINKRYAIYHAKNQKVTNCILYIILLVYAAGYVFLCFFYRTPMNEAHIRLELFWSYQEAFEDGNIVRLGVARSILLNILIMIPLGYLLPAVFRQSTHPYRKTFLTIGILSLSTELIQYLSKTGLCETDDLFNNMLGGSIGIFLYILIDMIIKKVQKQ